MKFEEMIDKLIIAHSHNDMMTTALILEEFKMIADCILDIKKDPYSTLEEIGTFIADSDFMSEPEEVSGEAIEI